MSRFQFICCNEFTELESMRLSLEVPGLLLAGSGLDTIAAAARGLNIPTSQASSSEEAMASYRSSGHTLVILDMKPGNHFDPHTVTRYTKSAL